MLARHMMYIEEHLASLFKRASLLMIITTSVQAINHEKIALLQTSLFFTKNNRELGHYDQSSLLHSSSH